MDERTYEVGGSKVRIAFGDITASNAEVVVSSDDEFLTMGGGVSRAIRKAAGNAIEAERAKMVPAKVGEVVVTSAGRLPAKYVFHAITVGWNNLVDSSLDAEGRRTQHEAIVRQATRRAMELLPVLGCRSIAFPAIGTGVARMAVETVASQMASSIVECLLRSTVATHVELFLPDGAAGVRPKEFYSFFEAFAARTMPVTTSLQAGTYAFLPLGLGPDDGSTSPEAERQQQVYALLRHLNARRNDLELKLIQHLTGEALQPDGFVEVVAGQLTSIGRLREGYLAEIHPSLPYPAVPDSVFLSSTALDLQPHRQALRAVIEGLGLPFIGMEEFSAGPLQPAELIREKVNQARVYLGVLGMRYGSVDPTTGFSMTELEYHQAVSSRKPICIFVMDNNAPITPAMVEDDAERFAKLLRFRKTVMKAHTCGMFSTVDELARSAERSLKEAISAPRSGPDS